MNLSAAQITWTPLVIPLLIGLATVVYMLFNAAREMELGIKRIRIVLLAAVTWWLICVILEMLGSTLAWKITITKLSYLGFAFIPTLMFMYAMQYVSAGKKLNPQYSALLLFIPICMVLLALTNDRHGLLWRNAVLNTAISPPALDKEMTAGFFVFIGHALLLSAIAFGYLLRSFGQASTLHRRHMRVLILSFITLNIAMAVNSIRIGDRLVISLEPYGVLIATLVLSRTIMRIRDSDMLPVARELAIDQLPIPVMVVDRDGNLVTFNQAVRDLLQIDSSNQNDAMTLAACCPPLAGLYNFPIEKADESEVEFTPASEKRSRIFRARISPVRDARELIVCYVISLQDITSMRLVEIERQRQHDYLQAIWTAIPDAVLVTDSDGIVKECNVSAQVLFGKEGQLLTGRSLDTVLPIDSNSLQALLSWVIDGNHELTLPQMQFRLSDTSEQPLTLMASGAKVIHDQALVAAILIFTDVTKLTGIEQELRDANTRLEGRVLARTSELVESNQRLQKEITRYQDASKSLTQRNRELLSLQSAVAATGSSLDIGFVLETVTWEMVDMLDVTACRVYEWDQDHNQVVLVADSLGVSSEGDPSQKTLDLSGCPIFLRTLTDKYAQPIDPHANDDMCTSCELCDAGSHRTILPMVFQGQSVGLMLLTLKDGSGTLNDRQISLGQLLANHAAVAVDHARLYSRAQHEITQRERVEQQLRTSLHEKDTLLQEIHHRVKNNLQVISSLLNLQSHTVTDPVTAKALQESQNRLRSMALIHERLYQSDNLARIDFGDYLRNLVSYLVRSYRSSSGPVAVGYKMDEIHLSIERAVPCGLIVNELVSNALKYAFPDNRPGRVEVAFTNVDGQAMLEVSDDGVGLPDNLDIDKLDSLGLQLVHMLTQQLHGNLNIASHSGTTFTISFEL